MRKKSNSLLFAGGHHARLIDERVPFHVISRVFQGRHLLRPCDELNDIIIGVVARALELFPSVKLYALAFMSNHLHMMLQGASHEVPSFIGFVKREISRRWGGRDNVNWPGTMWHEYLATALPTPESEEECFEYVLAQGVKENLVERPQDWPGVHTAKAIMGSGALIGTWFDATGYARALDAERKRVRPRHVKRSDFMAKRKLTFMPLPSWHTLSSDQRVTRARAMITTIAKKAQDARQATGAVVAGIKRVLLVPRSHITKLAPLPWFEKRRRMICWADRRHESTKRYIADYWRFQDAFSAASEAYRNGDVKAAFPPRSFCPVIHRHVN
jgi:REP element-mobilizing transposase RayT